MIRNIVFLLIFACFAQASFAQADEDSCGKVQPSFTASFDGVTAKGMLSPEELVKLKKLIPDANGLSIIRFTYIIDCGEDCDQQEKIVYGDTFSEEDQKALQAMKSRNVLSLQCILGKNKKGELVSFKPFLYYIR